MKKTFKILSLYSGTTYSIPIFLDETINNLGIMVGFDGQIEQIEQKDNFTYSGNTNTITVFNTINTNKIGSLINSVFTIYWGDGGSDVLPMPEISSETLPSVSHPYILNGTYNIRVTVNSPWGVDEVIKEIVIPFIGSYGYTSNLGTVTFTAPISNVTEVTSFTESESEMVVNTPYEPTKEFYGIGNSRVDELKKYGTENEYSGIVIISGCTGYTLDGLFYLDKPTGETIITGTVYNEDTYNGMITRNEHFLGFIDEPVIFSDVFVDRGKMGVMEKNLRLSEIDNLGELDIYGNGYFNVRKQ